jgi:hypothetical protein
MQIRPIRADKDHRAALAEIETLWGASRGTPEGDKLDILVTLVEPYEGWSKDFLEAGKKRLAGDTARAATSDEVKDLRREASALKEVVADLTLENRLLKKSVTADGEDDA